MTLFPRPRRTAALSLALLALLCNPLPAQQPAGGAKLELRPNDHIAVVGNTLADRMQHDAWIDAYLHTRFPDYDLAVRHLGFSGDELTLRLRSSNFGSPDAWLARTKTDVVLAFFGYNESFAGPAGLAKFRADLDDFLKKTLKQKYNSSEAPRVALFSPIAHEDLKDRNLPDGAENNKRLAAYTAAMAEVAAANKVAFVDLFRATRELYQLAKRPLTINGVHLNSAGNEQVAKAIDRELFAGPAPKRNLKQMEKVRQAALDRNHHWFNRYRTVDGYSIYGGRADLKFVGGQTNRVVMQREMEILDQMTANRDQVVWAAARGQDAKPDDSNLPAFIPVESNKPGKGPGGKHLFLGAEEAIKKMTVAKGMKVNLFADEVTFPELKNPVQMAWDSRGRLWVACWPTYPHWKPGEPMHDRILVFEDTDGDGKADKCTNFAPDLHCPTGLELYKKGVLVGCAPDVFYLEDTDGDGKYDKKERVISGIDSADTHHAANSFILDPGGALYFQEGTFHHTQVETPWGPPVRSANAGVFRYEPRTHKFEVYVNFGFANPHGHAFDRWGQDIVVDGTGSNPYHAALFSGQTDDYKQRHSKTPMVYKPRTRPCPGIEFLSSGHFPAENQGNLLVGNVIGFHGILQYKLLDKGASFEAAEVEPIVSSSDPNFRPSDLKVGPDGAIYFSDWHNPIIGHMQHNLRDPNRNRDHGRIYRVSYPDRPLLKPVPIHGEPVEKLLDVLKQPEDRVRYRARIELGGRDTDQVIAAAKKWAAALDPKDPEHEHHMLEALWLHQSHNVVNEDLLKRMLRSPDYRARAAATRVLCYWRDRVGSPLELLRAQINDSHPRVRLEAIRAVSFFRDEAALAVAVELLAHADDQYLRYVFNETLNTLERRLAPGKLNRGNIAATLLQLLDKGKVAPERRPVLLDAAVRHGGAKELTAVWQQALRADGYPADLRRQVLGWLAEAAATRQVRPTFDPEAVRKLLAESGVRREATRLAAAWKVKEAAEDLRAVARDAKGDLATRGAAIDALASLGDADSTQALIGLTLTQHPLPVRFRATAALARVNPALGAGAAAGALAAAGEQDDPGEVVEAFLTRKGGGAQLAAALEKAKLPADAAKRILRSMYAAGLNDARLSEVAGKLAGLDAAPKPPTADEVRRLMDEVRAKGDAGRGERVFLRADLGCVKCHAVNRAGGHVGPDLGPIGGSSPLDYIITAILDPNASIKEEYLTKVISTATGELVTGVVVERNRNVVVLKDGTGKLVRIPVADIDTEGNGKSLMPEGVTRILTRAETLDLIRFVSELGRPGGDYPAVNAPTVRRWKRLREVPAVLREGVPNREAVRELLQRDDPSAWETVYAAPGGTLALGELRRSGGAEVLYLQGEINVTQGGPVEVRVTSKSPVTFWVDEEPFENQGRGTVTLAPGRHRITVRVAPGEAREAALRVEVARPDGSRAAFEVVQGE